jgi:plasmid stabilization system protein ParE
VNEPLRIELSEAADRHVREADAWWRINRPSAANAIREELERVSALIAMHPKIGTRARNVRLRGVRRIHIERVHYDVYYRIVGDPPHLQIVGFWGSRRGSGPPI